jgi:hypothetical protein
MLLRKEVAHATDLDLLIVLIADQKTGSRPPKCKVTLYTFPARCRAASQPKVIAGPSVMPGPG